MKEFLFSVDLELFYATGNRAFRMTPLPALVEVYLEFLRSKKMRATFFVVGQIAAEYPGLIRAIEAEGHELASHTHTHRPLNEYTEASLREDLQRNLGALQNCATARIQGFRAPVLSLTEKTRWAYKVLADLGFRYSSSVLPASNPLHGWPGFGDAPIVMDEVVELPVTIADFGFIRAPLGAGTYFRCLPFPAIVKRFHALAEKKIPVVGYFHPYDCDSRQQWIMNKGVRGNPFLNALLFVNRSKTIGRLEKLAEEGFAILPYRQYLAREFSRVTVENTLV